jgi:hypothetical protein
MILSPLFSPYRSNDRVWLMGVFQTKMHWKKYNRELANRGSITVYLGDDLASKWASSESATPDRGRPVVYPDQVVLLGLLLQQIYRLPLRQTVGLMRSVLTLSGVALAVPDPSTLCRRRRHLGPASLAQGWWMYRNRFHRPSNPRPQYLAHHSPWAEETHLPKDPSRRRSRLLLDCRGAGHPMPNPRLGGLRPPLGYRPPLRRPGSHRRRGL